MPELQLKINIGDVEINIQGEGTLVHTIISELRNEGLGKLEKHQAYQKSADNKNTKTNDTLNINNPEQEEEQTRQRNKTRKKSNVKPLQLIKDLNLRGGNGTKGLNAFVTEKNPLSNIDRSTVFVYYLENLLKVSEVTIDHVYTCYKELGLRVPGNLQQNLTDIASSKNGYLNRKDGKYTMTIKGSNFVEQDLPKKEG